MTTPIASRSSIWRNAARLVIVSEAVVGTRVPTTASETMTNRAAFRQMLDRDAIGVVMFDTGWVGGISEGHAIGKLAETYHRPIAPHDCTGPVTYIAGTHLCQ